MDVDYSNGAVLPINQQLLLSGSAFKFEIPDSNYTAYRNVALRYDGSKTTSPGFNQPIYNRPSDAFVNNQYSIVAPSTQSQQPNASRYSNYFIYFDYIETAFPEVPNGSNIHAVYAITTEGKAIPLTGDNTYINEISNIFVSGTLATILPTVYAAGKKSPQVTVFDGGARYQTIMTLSGSTPPPYQSLGVIRGNYNPGINYQPYFFTGSSNNILQDSPLASNNYWFRYILPSGGLETSGYAPDKAFLWVDQNFYLYDTSIDSLVGNSYSGNGTPIQYSNTLLPIQRYDLIRLGDSRQSGSSGITSSGSLDASFSGLQLLTITSASVDMFTSSSIFLSATVSSSLLGTNKLIDNTYNNYQNYRIFRRLTDETNIVISTQPTFRDPGFLIPNDFNPAYNPYDLAQKAGIIA
jgi:hypothetical protein